MTNVVRLPQAPAPSRSAALENDIAEAAGLAVSLASARCKEVMNLGDMDALISSIKAFRVERFESIRQDLDLELAPATEEDVAKEVERLNSCFVNEFSNERDILIETMCEDVASLQPSCIALRATCRQLRFSGDKLPTIKLMTERIRAVTEYYQRVRRHLDEVPMLLAALTDRRERMAELQAQPERDVMKLLRAEADRLKAMIPSPADGHHGKRVEADLATHAERRRQLEEGCGGRSGETAE